MRISVLTPTIAGREDMLRRATYSVRWQTWMGSCEHVVVPGDGLTPAQAFQAALDRAKGDLIVPLPDDDWLAPHAIQTLHDLIDGHDFASGRTLISGNGTDTIIGEPLSEDRFREQGFVFGGAHMWRKTLTNHIGGFNPAYPNTADYDLYWRIAEARPHVAFTPEILYYYTDHAGTDANTNGAAIAEQCARIREAHL